MHRWILADSDFDGWLRIIILVLVFGGSFLSAILKTIIKKFSPKEEDQKSKTTPRTKFDRPVAKPMPGRPVQRAQPRSPAAKPRTPVREEKSRQSTEKKPRLELPVELPEIFAEIFPDVVAPRRPKDRLPQPPVPSTQSKRPSRTQPKKSRRVVRAQDSKTKVAKARKVEAKKPVGKTTEERLGTLTSSFESGEERLGHLGTRVDPHPGSAYLEKDHDAYDIPAEVDGFKAGVFHVDRQDLRRAIIFNEILAPPLALREDEI